MYAFAINIVVSSIDMKICKTQDPTTEGGVGKCKKASNASGSDKKLSVAFTGTHATSTEKVDAHTSKTIAIDTEALTREETTICYSIDHVICSMRFIPRHS